MHGKRRILITLAVFALAAHASNKSSNIAGLWQTVDDKTHQPRGVVSIYKQDGEYFGKIVSSFNPKEARETCTACRGELHDKPVIGLEILRGMREDGDAYSGGTITDPDTGESYHCKMTVQDNGRKLLVRGYIGFAVFGRTQVWTRYTQRPGMRETGSK